MERGVWRGDGPMNDGRIAAGFSSVALLLLLWCATGFGMDDRAVSEPPVQPGVLLALTNEREVAEMLPGRRWSAELIAEIASRIASLPDQAACELLWRLAAAPPGVDVDQVFSSALESASPRVRGVARELLTALGKAEDGDEAVLKPER